MIVTDDLQKVLDIGIALTNEKDYDLILEKILKESMSITNCDAGTLYIMENNSLRFKIMRNQTLNIYQGGKGEVIELPNVPRSEEHTSELKSH